MHPTIHLEHAPPHPGRPLPVRALLTLAGSPPAAEPAGPRRPAARDVLVEVRPGPSVWMAAVRHPYPASPTEDGLRIEMGDVSDREPKRLLLELLLEEVPASGDAEVVTVSLAADVPEAGGGVVHRELDLSVTLDVRGGPRVDPEVRQEALRLEAARARERGTGEERRGGEGAAARAVGDLRPARGSSRRRAAAYRRIGRGEGR